MPLCSDAETKLWRQDLASWDAELKPRALKGNRALQAVSPATLSDVELKAHFDACYAHLLEMVWEAAPDIQTRTVDMHVQRLRTNPKSLGV